MCTTSPVPAHALEVRSLTKRYGSLVAARDISFTAERGSITALLGPNGAGKSTTIGCATGLVTPDAGRVSLMGTAPASMTAHERARVGVMLQDGGLSTSAKARELLDYGARMFANPRNTDELAEILDIDSFGPTIVRRLSGGQRQRLSLALALVGSPQVLFLDEPTAGMDAGIRRRTRELIRAEADRGCAVILTTHAIDDVMELADHAVMIARGEVLADGTPTHVAQLLGGVQSRTTIDADASSPAQLQDFLRDVNESAARHGVKVTEVAGAGTLEAILADLSTGTRTKESHR